MLLGTIDARGSLVAAVGVAMSHFPLNPLLSKILTSLSHKALDSALSLVAMMSAHTAADSDILLRPPRDADDAERESQNNNFKLSC